jgi:hypothetical protein
MSGTTLTVTTTAQPVAGAFAIPMPPKNLLPLRQLPWMVASVAFALMLIAGIFTTFELPRARRIAAAAALAGSFALLAGCGGGSVTPPPISGTPAGTYSVTVKAAAGAQTASTTVNVVVQ